MKILVKAKGSWISFFHCNKRSSTFLKQPEIRNIDERIKMFNSMNRYFYTAYTGQ